MSTPAIIASNLRLITANHIVGLADVEIVRWRLVLRNCRWKKDETGEHVTLGPCDGIQFTDPVIAQRFQVAALMAIRALAKQVVAP